jgi:hypothetical protein
MVRRLLCVVCLTAAGCVTDSGAAGADAASGPGPTPDAGAVGGAGGSLPAPSGGSGGGAPPQGGDTPPVGGDGPPVGGGMPPQGGDTPPVGGEMPPPGGDADGDGVPNGADNCLNAPNPAQRDADADGQGDACDDGDSDLDGVADREDLCPAVDVRPVDTDADGVGDQCDNCPDVPNADQIDADADTRGDACEDPGDLDEDGVRAPEDNCEAVPNPDQADLDVDGRGDACDLCPTAPDFSQRDTDGDGVGDACDPCPDVGGPIEDQRDADGDGLAACAGDCDDADPAIGPGAAERCNAADDDCDGRVDEDWPDLGAACEAGLGACRRVGVRVCGADGAPACDARPGAPAAEICNEVDDDCDGAVDDGVPNCCQPGARVPCGSDVGACTAGVQVCADDRTFGRCDGIGPVGEACNGVDDDCDGTIDDGIDLANDPSNCGQCRRACAAGELCLGGDCVVAGALRNRVSVCGTTERALTGITSGRSTGLRVELTCTVGPDVQALLYPRDGGARGEDWNAIRAWVQAGGQVVTEYTSSIFVYNTLMGAALEQALVRSGGCGNTVMPRFQRNPADPFWQDRVFTPPPAGADGCGYPLPIDRMPTAVPLGGWDANTVSLAYVPLGQGRLWLVEADWQDAVDPFVGSDLALSDALLAYMISGGRTGVTPGQCQNAIDDDADGYFDLDDRGCDSLLDAIEGDLAGLAPACSNDVDDDGNGRVDFPGDPGCTHAADVTERAPAVAAACSNGRDDDGDGRTDFPADLECVGAGGEDEDAPTRFQACANGVDDDLDGLVDFPDEPECDSPVDANEGVGVASPACSNNRDDDADGLTDLADTGCTDAQDETEGAAVGVPQCGNGVDDDVDGRIDYPADLQCEARGDVCEAGEAAACQGVGPVQTFFGVQTEVDPATLGGWRLCYDETYGSGTPLADMVADCDGTWLMYACREARNDTLQVAAMAPRADVLFDTGPGQQATHLANGVLWYWDQDASVGFAPEGATVSRNTCDVEEGLGTHRLCWHTGGGRLTPGWRCGLDTWQSDESFRRLVYTASP